MNENKFQELWDGVVAQWLKESIKVSDSTIYNVSDLCSVKPNACKRIYNNYTNLKKFVKDNYFQDSDKSLSRYKRASVLVASIILGEDPLKYKFVIKKQPNDYFLKQRFAVFMALSSIVEDYKVESRPIFYFNELGEAGADEDDFLKSVYKDLLYSEAYKNYNVLTMANVFGLLTERASGLKVLRDTDQ